MQVQTGGSGSGTATEEFILLKNIAEDPVLITDWCVEYSSASDNVGFEKCIEPPNDLTDLWVEAGGVLSISTSTFSNANPTYIPDFVMSGGLAGTGGHLRLLNQNSIEIDKVGWGSAVSPEGIAAMAHSSGEVLSRSFEAIEPDTDVNAVDFASSFIIDTIMSGLYEEERILDLCNNIENVQTELPDGYLATEEGDCFEDMCSNIEGLQIDVPIGYEKQEDSADCTEIPLEDSILEITELLPNVLSVDTGREFIELFNPNSKTVELFGYRLEVGPTFDKQFVFTEGQLEPGQYLDLSDEFTGITLPNASGVSLRLVTPTGTVVSQSDAYTDAQEDESWALLDEKWVWTNQPTPSSANKPSLEEADAVLANSTTTLGPCPEGKFRNPETNRCKNIESAVSVLKPCDPGQERNPDTNRCRNVASTTSSLTPCKPGQVRNPETNRCRSVSNNSGLEPCPEGKERNPETNRCRNVLNTSSGNITPAGTVEDVTPQQTPGSINWMVIIVALSATVGYIIYEWRIEIRQKVREIQLTRASSN